MEQLAYAIIGCCLGAYVTLAIFTEDTQPLKRRAAAYKGLWLKSQEILKQWKKVVWRGRKDG
jgi:hypothetical protein